MSYYWSSTSLVLFVIHYNKIFLPSASSGWTCWATAGWPARWDWSSWCRGSASVGCPSGRRVSVKMYPYDWAYNRPAHVAIKPVSFKSLPTFQTRCVPTREHGCTYRSHLIWHSFTACSSAACPSPGSASFSSPSASFVFDHNSLLKNLGFWILINY